MHKKQNHLSVRQAAEKVAIRDEQNRRIDHAAHFPVKFLQISFRGIAFSGRVWYSGFRITASILAPFSQHPS